MQQPLRLGELQRALKKLKPRKSPGPAGITSVMLIHLGSAAACIAEANMRLTGVQPLGQRRDAKNMMHAEKFKCMTSHPMKTRLEGLTKNRLKRSSFVHESKKLNRQFHDRLPQSTLPFFPPDMPEPWVTDITDIKVHTTVPCLSGGDTQGDTVKQSLTQAMTAERYPQKAWTYVFTDGSATNAVTNGGAAILVRFP